MRVAVVGAGAMGSIFGAALAEAGVDTLMVDVNPALVKSLNDGTMEIRRDGASRRVSVPATTDPNGELPADVLVVFVKCWATEAALGLVRPLLASRTTVLTLQNGWGNGETIARHVGTERVLIGVTYMSATLVDAQTVDHTAFGTTYFGPLRPMSEDVAATFTAAGLPSEAVADIDNRIWRKLMLNLAANPVAALSALRSDGLLASSDIDGLMQSVVRESVKVAAAEGHAFDAEETIAYVRESLRKAGRATASMRQDVAAGRPTEIEVITGAIIRAADRHGIAVPVNRTIYALVKGYEASRS